MFTTFQSAQNNNTGFNLHLICAKYSFRFQIGFFLLRPTWTNEEFICLFIWVLHIKGEVVLKQFYKRMGQTKTQQPHSSHNLIFTTTTTATKNVKEKKENKQKLSASENNANEKEEKTSEILFIDWMFFVYILLGLVGPFLFGCVSFSTFQNGHYNIKKKKKNNTNRCCCWYYLW